MVDLNYFAQAGVRKGICVLDETHRRDLPYDPDRTSELELFTGHVESHLPDPYQCCLEILVDQDDGKTLRNLYAPLLQGIDPTFQFINIQEVQARDLCRSPGRRAIQDKENSSTRQVRCPAINIGLFLREDSGFLSAEKLQGYFQHSTWKLHHSVTCPNRSQPTMTMRQDFYQNFTDLPLWTVRPVHYGNEHLRFYIFVTNFTAMKSFYEIVLDTKATYARKDFCYFVTYSQAGLDIQLALKHSKDVSAEQTHTTRLKFRVKDIYPLCQVFYEPVVPTGKDNTWVTLDPDGNTIILEQTRPVRTFVSLLAELDQTDRSSEISSSGYNSVTNESYEEFTQSLEEFEEIYTQYHSEHELVI